MTRRWTLKMVGTCGVALLCGLYAACGWGEIVYWVGSNGEVTPVDAANPGIHARLAGEPVPMKKSGGITFTVVYKDVALDNGRGFDDPTLGASRRACVDRVLNYLDSVLAESGGCDVVFQESLTAGTGVLASAGTYFDDTPGFTNGYAFEHITTGVAPSASIPDIDGVVDFGWAWYTGTGTVPNNKLDLSTVLLHEMTHGLGLISVSGALGQSLAGTHVYALWDSLLETGNGLRLFGGTPPAFQGVVNDLLGLADGIVFAGEHARDAYGVYPAIYASNPYELGSSLAHWDTTVHAVMTPSLGYGMSNRQYAPVDVGGLEDIGYDTVLMVTPVSGAGGSVSPAAPVAVAWGENQTFTITANAHYHVADVLVDGMSVGAVVSYTFTSVTAPHTIEAHFAIDTFAVTPSAGAGGTISPATPVHVPYDTNQTFTITANAGHAIAGVSVDGVDMGVLTQYTFTHVSAPHTISATFSEVPSGCTGGSIDRMSNPSIDGGSLLLLGLTAAILSVTGMKRGMAGRLVSRVIS